mmetsp:Transcript_3850/g.11958  ORF Transcript_3850/g.11958 Transcript_3850/m.11958 type:complete len:134 (-) Transcript_3850:11140-11541(-)
MAENEQRRHARQPGGTPTTTTRPRSGAATDEWTGDVETSVAFADDESATIQFEKIVEDGRQKLRCRECGDKLSQTAAHFRQVHARTHRKPTALAWRPHCHPELVDSSSKKRKSRARPTVWTSNMRAHWSDGSP